MPATAATPARAHRDMNAAWLALPLAALACLAAPPVQGQESVAAATAEVAARDGTSLGTVRLEETASGMVHARTSLHDLPEGPHAIHLHETGDCSAADFTSAGGHIAGDATHGVGTAEGPHPGDMPNIHAGPDGAVETEVFLSALDLPGMIGDADGAALIVHEGADDYESQPAGAAGPRIACGPFEIDG